MSEIEEMLRNGPFLLQRAGASRFHEIKIAIANFGDVEAARVGKDSRWMQSFLESPIFVVEHNWSAAFGAVLDKLDFADVRLPFDRQVFEFEVSGFRVAMLLAAENGHWSESCTWIQNAFGQWAIPPRALQTNIGLYLAAQVCSACVALDTEIAREEIIERQEKLQRARERRGRPRFSDYHVLRLTGRHQRDPASEQGGRSPRFHFRRGHWRHFDDGSRTYIRWQLVGDASLGFVDKDYRL